MLVGLGMVINDYVVPLKTSFLQHIRQKIFVNIVVQVFYRDFNRWRFSDVIFVYR